MCPTQLSFFPCLNFRLYFTVNIPAIHATDNADVVVEVERDPGLVLGSSSGDARIDVLTQKGDRMSTMIADLTRAVSAEPSEFPF